MNRMKIVILALGLITSGCLVAMDDVPTQIKSCEKEVSDRLSPDMPKSFHDEYIDCSALQDSPAEQLEAFKQLLGKIKVYNKKSPAKVKRILKNHIATAEAIANKPESFTQKLESLKGGMKDDNTKCKDQEILDELQNLLVGQYKISPIKKSTVKTVRSVADDKEKNTRPDQDHDAQDLKPTQSSIRVPRLTLALCGGVTLAAIAGGVYYYFKKTDQKTDVTREAELDEAVETITV